jgi:hypothetical protein
MEARNFHPQSSNAKNEQLLPRPPSPSIMAIAAILVALRSAPVHFAALFEISLDYSFSKILILKISTEK